MAPLKHVYRCGCLRKVEISMLRLPGDVAAPMVFCPSCCAVMGAVQDVVRREAR